TAYAANIARPTAVSASVNRSRIDIEQDCPTWGEFAGEFFRCGVPDRELSRWHARWNRRQPVPSFQLRAVLILTTAAVAACGGRDAPAVAETPKFPVAVPVVKDTVLEREYVAEIRAVRHAELRSRFKGILERVLV